jgi:glutathione synthase
MKVAFLMDPLGSMSLNKDSSYALMKAALQLKQEVYHFELLDLSLFGSTPRARVRKLSGLAPDGAPEVERAQQVDLDVMDAIWVRKDPPFDRRYFYATLILDYLKPQVFVINGAQALRDINEKLGALFFFTSRSKDSRVF